MRMQIFLPDELVNQLQELAWNAHRYPKQQAEWLLQRAIEQTKQDAEEGHDEQLARPQRRG